jgi:hypothetical protein
MKFSGRKLLIVGMVAVILFLLFGRGLSLASDMAFNPPTGMSCASPAVAATAKCEAPYPNVGTISKDGTLKYCCK